MTLFLEQLEARLPRSASDNSRHNLRAVFGIADAYRAKADAIRNDGRLSYVGKDEALAKLPAETMANGHFQQVRSQSVKAQERLKTERETLRAASLKPEAGDVMAEMQRAEIRGMLRALPEVERTNWRWATIRKSAAPWLFANRSLSGVPADIHGKILDGIVEIKNQTRNAELGELEQEAGVVAAAVAVAEGTISRG